MLIAAVTQLQTSVTKLTGQLATITANTENISKMLEDHVAWEEEQRKQYDKLKETVTQHSWLIKAVGTAAAVSGAGIGWVADRTIAWLGKHGT